MNNTKLIFRLRKDMGAITPSYTITEVLDKMIDGSAKYETSDNGTIFILDILKTNKIMAVIEK